jgi:hypothetical protein
MSAAERQLNPSEFSEDQLDRIAFAIAGRLLKIIDTSKSMLDPEEAAAFTRYSRRRFDELVAEGVFIPRRAGENTDPKFVVEELIAQMPQRKRKITAS